MAEGTYKGTQVSTGDRFGIVGYWINKDQTHPIRMLYESNPEDRVPGVTEKLVFIYYGEKKPSALEISTLIADAERVNENN